MSPGITSTAQGIPAAAEHLCLRHLEIGQRVDAGARLQFLPPAQEHVQEDQQRHDDPGGHLTDHEANDSSAPETCQPTPAAAGQHQTQRRKGGNGAPAR